MRTSTATALDQAYLKQRLDYDPSTGALTWKYYEHGGARDALWNARFAEVEAGSIHSETGGYRRVLVSIDDKPYTASRLIWLYMTGSWPAGQVDHIDHDPTNNRWANLREVTFADNMKNRSKPRNNTSGVAGVCWIKQNSKWQARIRAGGKSVSGGCFEAFEDAVARRKELEVLHGFHSNHGKAPSTS